MRESDSVAGDGSASRNGARVSGAIVGGAAALALASVLTLLALSPDGVRQSADPGAAATPLWMLLLPQLAAIALIRLLPPAAPMMHPVESDPRAVLRTIWALAACAIAFPLIVGLAGISASEWYFLAKIVLLIAVPAILIRMTRGSISSPKPRRAWNWWAPIIVVAVWTVLSQASPWLPEQNLDFPDIGLLIAGAVLTALTAGVGEEFFYRKWLQTRLEGRLGRWAGIALASLAFALMHLGGDRQGAGPVVEIAAAIVIQGSFGVMLGYLWSKYRNLSVAIAAHVIANGYGVVVYLLS